uniref:Uncharacterized protein n=1 Tax=Arundo donax TaxID=35708 RepID=A0A0A9AAJ6_ARUDO
MQQGQHPICFSRHAPAAQIAVATDFFPNSGEAAAVPISSRALRCGMLFTPRTHPDPLQSWLILLCDQGDQ